MLPRNGELAAVPAAASTHYLQRPRGRIAYDVDGEGPLVICVPGMGDVRSVYRFLAPTLIERGYRVATMDLRGHGDSDATFDAYDDVAAGADVIALVDHLGGPAVLIGNSMGAGAAASAAAEAPHLVSGLVLIGPFVRNPPVGFAALLAFRLALLRPWGPAAWRAYYASQYPGRRPADLAEHQARIREYLRRPRYWRAFAATTHTSHQPVEERLGTIHTPTLVVMGDHDRDFRDPAAEARLIADQLDGAVVMIPGAGHYPQAEYPEIVSAAVLNLLTVINAQRQWEESSMHEYFASADYRVLDGRQEEFVAAFVEWFEWTRDEFPAFGSARLMRDTGATLHFVSWSSWKDAASREAWRASDEFARRLERVRALCEELRGADYSLAVAIGEQRAQSEMAA